MSGIQIANPNAAQRFFCDAFKLLFRHAEKNAAFRLFVRQKQIAFWTFKSRSAIRINNRKAVAARTIYFCLGAAPPLVSTNQRNVILVQVLVRDNNVDQALRALKKKMQREGIFREMKMRDYYEKPSEKRAREKAEAVRRVRKLARKRAQREGAVAAH